MDTKTAELTEGVPLNIFEQKREPKKGSLIIRPASFEEEFEYLTKYLLPNYKKFIDKSYSPLIPPGELFLKAAQDGVSSVDLGDLRSEFERIYDIDQYQVHKQDFFEQCAPVFQECLPIFEEWENQWGFKIYQLYDLRFSMYGPGGHYYPAETCRNNDWLTVTLKSPIEDTAVISVRAIPSTTFSRPKPDQSFIHESVHLGIQWMVNKYKLTQEEKERLVDNLVLYGCGQYLPGYEKQSRGDSKIDKMFPDNKIPENLPSAIEQYIKNNPRDI